MQASPWAHDASRQLFSPDGSKAKSLEEIDFEDSLGRVERIRLSGHAKQKHASSRGSAD